jgi:HlyD family secretion protein
VRRYYWFIILMLFIAGCGEKTYDAQGYAEGYFTYVSANFSGVLKELSVQRGAQVKINQALFVLEQQPESDAYKQAVARRDQTIAELSLAEINFKRQTALFEKGVTSKEALDSARTDFTKTQAQLAQANADLMQAQWTQAQKAVTATKNALVFDTYYLPGELVPAGQPVLSLLAPQDVYLLFFINESQLGAVHYGQTVYGYCDSCRNPIAAKISYISPQAEYTPPVIYSNEMRAKLVFRIEATPAAQDAVLLHPGQPISVNFK